MVQRKAGVPPASVRCGSLAQPLLAVRVCGPSRQALPQLRLQKPHRQECLCYPGRSALMLHVGAKDQSAGHEQQAEQSDQRHLACGLGQFRSH